jgi:hypothetical protein
MFHTIYDSFESKPGGRDYLGKHSTENPYDDYKGSFFDKTFEPDSKIIVGYSKTVEGAVWLEIQWQKVFGVAEDPQFANRSYQTSTKFNYDMTGFRFSGESIQKLKDSHTGKKDSEETRQKKSKAQQVAQNRPEVKEKHSRNRKGKPKSEIHKQRIRDAHNTPEAKEKKRKDMLGRDTGKKHTLETRQKQSLKRKGKKGFTNKEGKRMFMDPGETPPPGWSPGYKFSE